MAAPITPQEPKINWREAEDWYMRDPARTVADVCREFRVSRPTVYKWATRFRWEPRKKQLLREAHRQAMERMRDVLSNEILRRYRLVRRLVDAAVEDLTVNYSTAGAGHLLGLINIEKEIIDGLPADQSRERELRQHVEKALKIAGQPAVEDVI